MKGRSDFLLPDELGWKCNDEINAVFKQNIETLASVMKDERSSIVALRDVFIAETMDDIYAIIKKYAKVVPNENS